MKKPINLPDHTATKSDLIAVRDPDALKAAGIPLSADLLRKWHHYGKHPQLFVKIDRNVYIDGAEWAKIVEAAKAKRDNRVADLAHARRLRHAEGRIQSTGGHRSRDRQEPVREEKEMNILTDEEINDIFRGSWNCEEDNLTRGRDIEEKVIARLENMKSDLASTRWVCLKPNQVIAERRVIDSGEDGNWHYELVEVKP